MSQLINLFSFSAEGENKENEPIEVSRPDPESAENSERPQEAIANQEIDEENPDKSKEIQESPEAPDPQELNPSDPSEPSEPTDPSKTSEPLEPLKPSEIP